MNLPQNLHAVNLLFLAFLSNIPLGYLREGAARYSFYWFLYIHLSIPFIVAVRYLYGFGWDIVPYSLGLALAGQWFGGRMNRRFGR